jgi:hypothetical protein
MSLFGVRVCEEPLQLLQFLKGSWFEGLLVGLDVRSAAFLTYLLYLLCESQRVSLELPVMRFHVDGLDVDSSTFFNFLRCFLTAWELK